MKKFFALLTLSLLACLSSCGSNNQQAPAQKMEEPMVNPNQNPNEQNMNDQQMMNQNPAS